MQYTLANIYHTISWHFILYFYYFKSDLKIYVFTNQSLHLIDCEYIYIKLVYIH